MPNTLKTIYFICVLTLYLGECTSMIYEKQSTKDIVNYTDDAGMKQGLWVITKNGHKLEEGMYVNNIKTGNWRAYYDNQHLKHEINYTKGEARGTAHFYYENGKLRESGNWQIDHWEGSYKYYFESGQLSYDWFYNESGHRQGDQHYYHTNGKKMYEGHWKDGKTEGALLVYNDSGELIEEKIFNNGQITKTIKTPSSEHKKSNSKFSGTGFHTITNLSGNIDEKGYFMNGNLLNGEKHNYDKSGKLISITRMKNGKIEGN